MAVWLGGGGVEDWKINHFTDRRLIFLWSEVFQDEYEWGWVWMNVYLLFSKADDSYVDWVGCFQIIQFFVQKTSLLYRIQYLVWMLNLRSHELEASTLKQCSLTMKMRDQESSSRSPSVVNVWMGGWTVRQGPLPIANYPPDAGGSPDWSLQIRGRTRHSPMLILQTAPRPGSVSSRTTFIFLAPVWEELPAWLGALRSSSGASWNAAGSLEVQ